MRGRAALTAVALVGLLVLGLVAWFALHDAGPSTPSDDEGATGRGGGASLAGRPARTDPPTAPSTAPATNEGLGGRVVDAEGNGVAGATVFLLPRGEAGLDEPTIRAPTTPTGAFRLPPADLEGTWIGAVGPDHAVVHVAGEEAREGMVLVLPDGYALTLDVGVEQEVPVATVALRVTSDEGWPFPGPEGPVRVDRRVTVPVPGSLTIRLPSAGAVGVECLEPGVAWSPGVLRAESLPATVRLDLSPSMRAAVVVEEASTQDPYLGPGVARLFDLESGEELARIDGPRAEGRYVFRSGLRPRDHYITFEAPEYRPWRSARMKVKEGGRPMLFRARIIREKDVGDLLLDTSGVSRVAWRPAELKDMPWQSLRPRPQDGRVLLPALPVGRIHVILWLDEGGTTRTALLENAEVVGGQSSELGVAWQTGIMLPTPPGKSAVWGIEHARLGMVPTIRKDMFVALGAPWPLADAAVDVEYGPYPIEELKLKLVREVELPNDR